jgi:hypothetical protein
MPEPGYGKEMREKCIGLLDFYFIRRKRIQQENRFLVPVDPGLGFDELAQKNSPRKPAVKTGTAGQKTP